MYRPDNEYASYFKCIEYFTTSMFIIDYLLRLVTEDIRSKDYSWKAFLRYPITPYAVIDLLSILPTLTHWYFNPGFKVLRIIRVLKVLRVFKLAHYFKSIRLIIAAFRNARETLRMVLILALCYIFVLALIIFNVEVNTKSDFIKTFPDAIYFATVSLTTVGYGDIFPETMPGKIITICSSLVGIAVIALSSGIVTAGYIKAVEDENNKVKHKNLARRGPSTLRSRNGQQLRRRR